jgi:hypothetical protein
MFSQVSVSGAACSIKLSVSGDGTKGRRTASFGRLSSGSGVFQNSRGLANVARSPFPTRGGLSLVPGGMRVANGRKTLESPADHRVRGHAAAAIGAGIPRAPPALLTLIHSSCRASFGSTLPPARLADRASRLRWAALADRKPGHSPRIGGQGASTASYEPSSAELGAGGPPPSARIQAQAQAGLVPLLP